MVSSDGEGRPRESRPVATDDWPSGYDQASWWPIVTALGIVVGYLGAGSYIVAIREGGALVTPVVGVTILVAGVLVAAAGAAGWTYQTFVVRYWEFDVDANRNRYLWGALLYFPVELALFGAGLLYFVFVYFVAWPPGALPRIFHPVVVFMTAVLFTSAFTLYFAGRELRKDNRRRFLALLAATPALGTAFLAGKAANYYRLVVVEGYGLGSGVYWTAFFGIDGLHGILVAVGVVLLMVTLGRASAGQFTPDRHTSLTTTAMYWWMLEAVWVLILVEIYGTAAVCRTVGQC